MFDTASGINPIYYPEALSRFLNQEFPELNSSFAKIRGSAKRMPHVYREISDIQMADEILCDVAWHDTVCAPFKKVKRPPKNCGFADFKSFNRWASESRRFHDVVSGRRAAVELLSTREDDWAEFIAQLSGRRGAPAAFGMTEMIPIGVLSRECRLRNISLANLNFDVLSGFWDDLLENQRSAVRDGCKHIDGLFGTKLVASDLLPCGPIGDLSELSMPKYRKVPNIAPEFQALLDDYLNRQKNGRVEAFFGTQNREIDTEGVKVDCIRNINVAIRWFWHGLVTIGVVNSNDNLDLEKISDPVLIHDVVEACASGCLGSPCSSKTRRAQTHTVINFMNTIFPGYAAEIDTRFFDSSSLRCGNKDTVDRARKRAECLEFIDDLEMQREFFSMPRKFFDAARPAISEMQALGLSRSRMLTNDQHYALELAIMAALTAINTKIPERLKTIHQFDINGSLSNFSYPDKGFYEADVLLRVPAHITKNGHFAEGVPLKKSRVVDPRRILNWYRDNALPLIVTHKVPQADLRRPSALFGGLCIDTIRRIWRRHTAACGLFITPHMTRHLLASVLYARGTAIELIAELLGDKVATVEERYVFVNRIKKIREVMEVQAELFKELDI